MSKSSRIPGFYRLSLEQRRKRIAEFADVQLAELEAAVQQGGLLPEAADKFVENVLGVYGLPFGVALNVLLNGVDRLVPMVVEEPSVVAAASNAARMIRECGGFKASVDQPLMTTQIQLYDVPDPEAGARRLLEEQEHLLALATLSVPGLVERGGGPRSLEVRKLPSNMVVVHIHVDCKDAMGANLVNTVAEAVGHEASKICGGKLGLRILTNLCDRRLVRVSCRVGAKQIQMGRREDTANDSWAPVVERQGEEVIDGIVQASRFAEVDPYRAATHNKGIMNGVDSVVLATGNDFRAVEAGAHAYAARSGRYAPLAVWSKVAGSLQGRLEMPLALGIVGGTLRVHPTARLALKLAGVSSADDLAMLAAAVGLASNLAALRALATEGIQRGHMSLHARSVAVAAGATGSEVEVVAARITQQGQITEQAAQAALMAIRTLT